MRPYILFVFILCGELTATANSPIQLQITTTPSTCGQSNGIITATALGGTAPYTYSLDGGPSKNNGLYFVTGPSSHTLTVKDITGLTASATVVMPNTNGPVSLQLGKTTEPSGCTVSDGSMTLQGLDGTPPYQYSMDGINWQASPTFSQLPNGNFSFFVQDANGCTNGLATYLGSSITTCLGLQIVSFTAAGCANDGTLQLKLQPVPYNPPYSFSLDGVNYQADANFTGMAAGPHLIHIKDGSGTVYYYVFSVINGCTLSLAAVITGTTCNTQNGVIAVTGSNGVPPYRYSIDGIHYQSNNDFTGLLAGNYTVAVIDNAGSIQWKDVSVPSFGPQPLVSTTPASCLVNDGTLTIIGTGGTFPYQYSLDGVSYGSVNVFDQLGAKEYTAYLKDALGCIIQQSAIVPLNNTLTIDAGPDLVTCSGDAVLIGATSSGGTYSWQPSTGLNNALLLQPTATPAVTTVYAVTATNGACQQSDMVTVTVLPSPAVFAGNDTVVFAGQPLALHAVDLSGTGFTQFAWSPAVGLSNPGIQDPVAVLQQDMTYTVTASVNGSCSAFSSISIKVFSSSNIYVPSAFSPNGDGHNDVLRAKPFGIRDFQYFAVYSRWGQRLFYTTDPTVGWDGTFNGKKQEVDAYVWIAAGIDLRGQRVERKGTVILVR